MPSYHHVRTSTFDVRLRLRLRLLLVAIIFLAQSSYTIMGFARPYSRPAAHAKNPLLKTTTISDARSANTSSRVRLSQSTNYSDRSSKRLRIKTKTMLSSIIATLLMTIKPAGAATATAEKTKTMLSTVLAALSTTIKPAGTATAVAAAAPSYHLTRILFLRMLAIVYIAAFSVAKFQNKGLIGDRGVAPARIVLNDCQKRQELRSARRKEWAEERKKYSQKGSWVMNKLSDSRIATLFRDKFWFRTDRADRPLPCLLWLAKDRRNLNPWLDGLANTGLLLSTIILATGSANALLIFALWLIQRSFMSVGGVFYGYGWEPQLAELTFHAMFLVPLLSMDPFFGSKSGVFAVPTLVLWAIRFYLFKIMLGAGLIKIKSSDKKWKPGDMSTMYYFYETQPVPNPFSRQFHFMPKAWHKFEVWSNHFVELVAPFLLLLPFRKWRISGGIIQIMFQLTLVTSGNLSFLNWLTIAPALLCLDDVFLTNNLSSFAQKVLIGTPMTSSFAASLKSGSMQLLHTPMPRKVISLAFFMLMAKLNVKVVQNLLAKRQLMNASFDKLRLAGTYGAFGVVAEEREELIIESAVDANGPWKEYNFNVKPGDVNRTPRWISPYHHRIDWQLWISAQTGRIERNPWMLSFLLKLLQQEKDVIGLLESDPWDGSGTSPKYIRVEKYKYSYNKRGSSPYWNRERIGRYFPYGQGVLTEAMLKDIIRGR
mmetsp:Transcript_25720/g.43602  ORF Transcript_25720/g.43602 Transcript_25720/m.43602 type:complete len:711 (+) Transcript_25720:134-2266(+)